MNVRFLGADGLQWKPAAPVRISACLMVGDESHFIEDAITTALGWADEVVVLDTGSTDGTGDTAERLGARVVREPWRRRDIGGGLLSIDDFASARTRALSLGTGDWLVPQDADERIRMPRLRAVLEQLPECVDLVTALIRHVAIGTEQVMPRAYRRTSEPRYEHRVHETIDTWLATRCRVTAELPADAGYCEHLGSAPSDRARWRRDERNDRLLALMLAENPNEMHALSYTAQRLSQRIEQDAY